MNSRDLANWFGKQHAHIMRDIRSECKEAGIDLEKHNPYFGLFYYKDRNNRKRKQFDITRKGIILIKC